MEIQYSSSSVEFVKFQYLCGELLSYMRDDFTIKMTWHIIKAL